MTPHFAHYYNCFPLFNTDYTYYIMCLQEEFLASGSVLQRTNTEQCVSASRLHI